MQVNVKAFKQALAQASQVIEKRSTMPVLSNVLLTGKGSALRIESTDLELSHSYILDGTSTDGKDWSLAVNAKQLSEVLKASTAPQVTLSRDDGTLLLAFNGGGTAKLQGVDAQDYPMLNIIPDGTPMQLIERELLLDLLTSTVHAVSKDQTRYHLNGVYLESTSDGFKATATDGHRLSHKCNKSAAHIQSSIGKAWILPIKAVKVLISRLSKSTSPDVAIYIDGPWLHFTSEWILSVRHIEGKYPNYAQLIPAKQSHCWVAPSGAILSACKRLAPMTNKVGALAIDFDINQITMTAHNLDTGTESKESLNIACDFKLKTGFNVKYLIDALGIYDESDVATMKLSDNLSPMLMTAPNKALAVVMPMRI